LKSKPPLLAIDILTLFPGMFEGPFRESMIRLAKRKGLVKIRVHNLRKFTHDRHRKCDDKPFGGGPGMVMMAQPIFDAVESLRKRGEDSRVILFSPQGKTFTQQVAGRMAGLKHLILICGHYEGVDERVRDGIVDEEISVGDFVLTGGELPAMCFVDGVVRLVPGVVGNSESVRQESFQNGTLDFPHYTRPSVFRGIEVPKVLLTGAHGKIEAWRREQSRLRTRQLRPDLLREERTGRI